MEVRVDVKEVTNRSMHALLAWYLGSSVVVIVVEPNDLEL